MGDKCTNCGLFVKLTLSVSGMTSFNLWLVRMSIQNGIQIHYLYTNTGKYQFIDSAEIVLHPLNTANFWKQLFKAVRNCIVCFTPFSYQIFLRTSVPVFRSTIISARPMKLSPYNRGST
ncbi:hypothetical protein PAEAM_26750 [Paenibacillus sp. GM1FR]|nr:hypothetical protein PAEAM_26750 [Paenibacillus sp. GM1FR]